MKEIYQASITWPLVYRSWSEVVSIPGRPPLFFALGAFHPVFRDILAFKAIGQPIHS